jgi:hypothetical protein
MNRVFEVKVSYDKYSGVSSCGIGMGHESSYPYIERIEVY